MKVEIRAVARWLLSCLVLVVAALPAIAQATSTSPEISRGIQWLLDQVQLDGTLFNEQQSIAARLQSRSEVAHTLKVLATTPAGLMTAIEADQESNTEYLSRKIITLAANGWNAANYVDVLLQKQNADGGFGGDVFYESNVVDTAWAVLALAQANQASSTAAASARTYLKNSIAADGGVAGSSDADRVPMSALALLALQSASDGFSATATGAMASWLLQRQDADGGWSSNTYLTALSLLAVSPVTADGSVRANAGNFLLSRQSADGSWSADPFLTALALRALSVKSSSVVATPGTLKGQVVDPASGVLLAGASVTIAGPDNKTVFTDAGGNFVAAVAAGTYAITIASNGYGSATTTYNVIAGQTSNLGTIALAQLASAAIIRGQVTVGGTGAPLAGATISLLGSMQASAVSDANGRYELTSIAPGVFTISASVAGYQAVSASGTAIAGQTLIFSPVLYANDQTTPATTRYFGKVVASGTGAPLSGVTVLVNGVAGDVAVTTSATGQFDVTLATGSYSASFTFAGYDTVMQSIVVPAGAAVDAGTISMSVVKDRSTIKGHVLNAANTGIAGASVQLVGASTIVTTSADGSYVIDNVIGTTLSLRASANGYDSQTINLQLSKPGEVQQNFTLSQQGADSLSIGELNVSPTSIGAGKDVTVATVVTNAGSADASAIVMLQILDKDRKIIGTGAAYDDSGNLVGQITVAAGQQQNVHLVWNSAQHAPGAYTLVVRLVEVGSMTRDTPQGKLLTERTSSVAVTGEAHFSGTITANPPVLQGGTNTTVKLSATLRNDGNAVIADQPMTLTAIDTKTDTVVMTQQVVAEAMMVNELQTVQFADWTPTASGNFQLELVAADPVLGKATGTLYVGDAAKASYTVNKLVVPTGTQAIRASIKVTGQDIINGTISDPLVPLIKAAIQKSVTYNDREAVAWTARNQCIGCHTQAQAIVGGETNHRFATFDEGQRNALYNIIKSRQQGNGAFYDNVNWSYRNTSTMLAMWALDSWHDKNSAAPALMKGANYLLSEQQGNGSWAVSHPWLGTWTTPSDHTALNLKALIGLHHSIDQTAASAPDLLNTYSIKDFQQTSYRTAGALYQDADSNYYVSSWPAGLVTQFKPDGTPGMEWRDLPKAGTMVATKDGKGLLVTTSHGVYRLNPDGTKQLFNDNPNFEVIGWSPSGALFATYFNSSTIYQIDDAGNDSVFLSGSGIPNPIGFAFTDSGDMLLASYGRSAVLRIKPDKTIEVTLPSGIVSKPTNVMRFEDGWLVGSFSGLYRLDKEFNIVDRYTYDRSDSALKLQNGKMIYATWDKPGIREIVHSPIDIAAAKSRYADAIDKATRYFEDLDLSNSPNNLALAHQLMGLGEASRFYANDTVRLGTIDTKMQTVAALLKSRQLQDGSWGVGSAYTGDSFVTAHVGYALDYLNPSPEDPYIRNAVQWLLSHQNGDGSWRSENHIFNTNLAATTWVSIWLPVMLDRLGGVDTDLSVTFPANVTMSSSDRTPASTTMNADGTTTVIWNLTGVTSAGRTINYDLTLNDMAPNEVRAVSTDAHLTFKNSFTNDVVNSPIDVPRVTASAFLGLGVTTGKTSYPADALVTVTGQVTNTGADLSSGTVKFDVYAPDNTLIASLGTVPFSNVAAGSSINLAANWNVGATLANTGYYVLGTLYDSHDQFVGTAQSSFEIAGSAIGSPALTTSISTDKQTYQPSDTVKINDRIVNVTTNVPVNDLQVTTKVRAPDGTILYTHGETLAQLAQGTAKDYVYSVPLGFAAAGNYVATLTVATSNGTVMSQSQTAFAVASSASSGAGLTGTIAVDIKQVQVGDPANISFKVSNVGNAALNDLLLKVSIVDPAAQKVLVEFPYTSTIGIGADFGNAISWPAVGTAGSNYVAVLTATVDGKPITLAQDNFALIPAVKLTGSIVATPKEVEIGTGVTLSQLVSNDVTPAKGAIVTLTVTDAANGVLAFNASQTIDLGSKANWHLSTEWTPTGPVDTKYLANLVADVGNKHFAIGQDAFTIVPPPVKLDIGQSIAGVGRVLVLVSCNDGENDTISSDGKPPVCVTQRSQTIDQALAALGVTHTIVTNETAFRQALRSDLFNIYWISGKQDKLHDDLAEEVREAVNGGDGLVLDGVHDQRNKTLDVMPGIVYRGKIGETGLPVHIGGDDFETQSLDSVGRALKIELAGGVSEASFAGSKPNSGGPAIVVNRYGNGRSVLFAYDLASSLQAHASWQSVLGSGLRYVLPVPSASVTPGAVIPIKTGITNLAKAVDVTVASQLPQGALVVGTDPSGTLDVDGNTMTWQFNLPEEGRQSLLLTLRAPGEPGDYVVQTQAATTHNGKTTPYGAPVLQSFTVRSAMQTGVDVQQALEALILAKHPDRNARDRALAKTQDALNHIKLNTATGYQAAIGDLLAAIDEVIGLPADTNAIREGLDRMLREAEWRWSQTQ